MKLQSLRYKICVGTCSGKVV